MLSLRGFEKDVFQRTGAGYEAEDRPQRYGVLFALARRGAEREERSDRSRVYTHCQSLTGRAGGIFLLSARFGKTCKNTMCVRERFVRVRVYLLEHNTVRETCRQRERLN